MSKEIKMTKEEIIHQLKKEGVTNLDQLAEVILKKAHKDGDLSGPIVNKVIVYSHGFITA
jgi:hypothetical protein